MTEAHLSYQSLKRVWGWFPELHYESNQLRQNKVYQWVQTVHILFHNLLQPINQMKIHLVMGHNFENEATS